MMEMGEQVDRQREGGMNSLGHFHLIHEDREWEKTVSKMHVI